MLDSSKTEAERMVQREFRKTWLLAGTTLALSILLFRAELNQLPNRSEVGERTTPLSFQPAELQQSSIGPFRLVGAWRLLTDDARFGGISALAVDDSQLVAVSDSGVVARFPKPGAAKPRLVIKELPGGPGDGRYKVNRDSEALTVLPGGAWAVAFENRDEVWVYDRRFSRIMMHLAVNDPGLSRNRGIEGMIIGDGRLVLFPEWGGRAIRGGTTVAVRGVSGWLSDAVRLPEGQILVTNRRPMPVGLSNYLILLRPKGAGFEAAYSWRIPVGRLDNVEAIAAEPIRGGGTRLWMMTDNNLQQRRPTLLVAFELRPRPRSR